jgi:hypothetical protein
VLTIKRAKAFQGNCSLPPSPDLFLLSAFTALAAQRMIHISPAFRTPYLSKVCALLDGFAEISWQDNGCSITPRTEALAEAFFFENDQLPYRDLIVFLAISTRRPVLFKRITDERITYWREQAGRIGYTLENAISGDHHGLVLAGETSVGAVIPAIAEQDINAALGLFWGLRVKRSFQIGFSLSTPFRDLAKSLGCDISVKRDIGEAEKDPLVRRMKIMTHQRLSSQEQAFTIALNFSVEPPPALEITLPGDEVLFAQLLLAKALLHRGSLVIDNAPLEPWASPMLALMRKMGCKPSLQESTETSYGSCGMLSFQKFDLHGQKTDFSAQHQYAFQLPAMAILAGCAEGESLFRKFDDLRKNDPDAIKQLESCLKTMQVKFGDIPDGFVIKGSPEYDGFDLIEPLPAPVSSAFALAGLFCAGTTTIHDEAILERWPDFEEMINTYFEYRT